MGSGVFDKEAVESMNDVLVECFEFALIEKITQGVGRCIKIACFDLEDLEAVVHCQKLCIPEHFFDCWHVVDRTSLEFAFSQCIRNNKQSAVLSQRLVNRCDWTGFSQASRSIWT